MATQLEAAITSAHTPEMQKQALLAIHKQTVLDIFMRAQHGEGFQSTLNSYDRGNLLLKSQVFIYDTVPIATANGHFSTNDIQKTQELLGDYPVPLVVIMDAPSLGDTSLDLSVTAAPMLVSDWLHLHSGDMKLASFQFKAPKHSHLKQINIGHEAMTDWKPFGIDNQATYAIGLQIEEDDYGKITIGKFTIPLRPGWPQLIHEDGKVKRIFEIDRYYHALQESVLSLDPNKLGVQDYGARKKFSLLQEIATSKPEHLMDIISNYIKTLRHDWRPTTPIQEFWRGKIGAQKFPVEVYQKEHGWEIHIKHIDIPERGNLKWVQLPTLYHGDLVIYVGNGNNEISFARWTQWTDDEGNIQKADNAQEAIGVRELFTILATMEPDIIVPTRREPYAYTPKKKYSNNQSSRPAKRMT
jgi:hypothetical protein